MLCEGTTNKPKMGTQAYGKINSGEATRKKLNCMQFQRCGGCRRPNPLALTLMHTYFLVHLEGIRMNIPDAQEKRPHS